MITILEKGRSNAKCKTVIATVKGAVSVEILAQVLTNSDFYTITSTIDDSVFEGSQHYIRFPASGGSVLLDRMLGLPIRLGNVCAVRQGVLSNPDKFKNSHSSKHPGIRAKEGDGIFVVSPQDHEIFGSGGNLRPYFKNSQIQRYRTLEVCERELLYVTDSTKPSPGEMTHLEKFRSLLEDRSEFSDGRRPWFAMHRSRDEQIFEGPKIICPQRSFINTFGYNECSWYASADVYFIKESDSRFPLKCILGLLNSKLYYYWLYNRGKRKGEMLELFQVPLAEIPVPELTLPQAKRLTQIVNKCIESVDRELLMIEAEEALNSFVNELFNLSKEEIEVINMAYESALRRKGQFRDLDAE